MPVFVVCAALVALPWLWPLTYGPTAGTLPYLVSAATAALLLALWPRDAQQGVRVAAAGWLAAAVLSSAIALLQYFNAEAPLYPWVNQAQPGQAFGNLRQPNQLATLLAMGLLALRWWGQQGRLAWGWQAGVAALLLTALAATASRVGLVALLAVGAMVLCWGWRAGWAPQGAATPLRGRWALAGLAAGLGVYVAAALALPALLVQDEGVSGRSMVDRLQNAESTCGSRLILWRNVLHLIAQKPWTGWGWGELDYAHYATLYPGARFCHILDNAHNLPLHLAVTLGLPVALLVCALLLWAVWRGKPWREQCPARQLAWGVLAVISIHSLVEYPLWYGPFQVAALVCLWVLWAFSAHPERANSYQNDSFRGSAWPLWPRAAVSALLLAVVAYAGWDYHRISQIYLPVEQRAAAYQDDVMGHASRSWLFAQPVLFAQVTTRPATRANASWMLPAALQALHFSPEPRVIVRVIESATLLGQDALAMAHLARFRAAFAAEHQRWAEDNLRMLQGARELMQPASESTSQ
ncbi:MAG: Wzy polymerase domain-containing protein [Pseudomonadota bacterium]|nr:Wzy polymerase domain-containing protein [Pseudomonadota bacterium]